ncbi:MAG TPA: RluA family pseudouridine synthase [Solirubrobacteraceae bacterium]|jgi:23S rRNA pseudouridine1911/1915/1917 synthase|nr:RluA family pseudouridine synthase [Solirubrobacteraceae bacterium]
MPDDGRLRIEVPAAAGGVRLDRFLAEPLGSRAKAQTLIDTQRVRVDGRIRPKRHLVSAGELIDVEPGEADVVTVDGPVAPFGVAYEDQHLLVVDKPAGVVVHPARGHWSGTLAQALAGRGAGGDESWRAGIVHRLDRDTSGLLVVAKSDEVHRALKRQLKQRELHREYLALVEGRPPARTGTVEAPIGRHRRERTLMSIDTAEPREARTHFTLERALPDSALLRVVLDTGRTHQIRVHMAAIGHPVAGDPQYGKRGLYGLERQFLHAARLAFPHPVTAEAIDVSSPLPTDLDRALELATRG